MFLTLKFGALAGFNPRTREGANLHELRFGEQA